jgi:transcription elongation factor Elf1
MSRKEKRKHVKEHKHITHSDAKCIFCGSTDVTVHHVVFRRFAPELENDPNNQVPMCARCQRIYHQITDILLNYLKINSHQIDNHEIRLPKPILPPPKEEVKEIPQINISGGEITINF